jgi:hypothetical protein
MALIHDTKWANQGLHLFGTPRAFFASTDIAIMGGKHLMRRAISPVARAGHPRLPPDLSDRRLRHSLGQSANIKYQIPNMLLGFHFAKMPASVAVDEIDGRPYLDDKNVWLKQKTFLVHNCMLCGRREVLLDRIHINNRFATSRYFTANGAGVGRESSRHHDDNNQH